MRSRLVLAVLALALTAPPAAPASAEAGVWTSTLQATQGFDHLSAFPDGTFYAQYVDTYARSTDFGKTWQLMPKPPGHYYGAPGIRFASPRVGVAVTGASATSVDPLSDGTGLIEEIRRCGGVSPLRKTTDGGTTWRGLCVPGSSPASDPRWGPHWAPLAFAAGGRTIMVSGGEQPLDLEPRPCGADRDVIVTSHDGGTKWVRAALPRGWYGGYRQAAYDSRTLLRITYGGWRAVDGGCGSSTTGLFLSRDGGASFRRVLACGKHACTSVAMPTRNRIVVGFSDGSTMLSDDLGRRWRRGQKLFDARWQPLADRDDFGPDAFWVQGISFSDARHGYASTRGSGTWRTTDGGVSWTQEASHECAWLLHGVGEVAAGTKDTAITGGPNLISARTPAPAGPQGCAAVQPNVPAVSPRAVVASVTTLAGTFAVRADASLTLRR